MRRNPRAECIRRALTLIWKIPLAGEPRHFMDLSNSNLCVLRVSAFQERGSEPVNAEGARSGRKIEEEEDGKGGDQEGIFCWISRDCRSLRSPRLCVSRKGSCGPVNAEAQRNAEGARSGRKIGEQEDGKGGVQEGIFCWILRDCRSLRSPRLCVSKKTLGTAKRRGCAVRERDWRGGRADVL